MKAYIFPSRTVDDINYVLMEDGHFSGAFGVELPDQLVDGCEVVFLTADEARTHEGLAEALRLNKLAAADKPDIYVFSNESDPEATGLYFAMAESGYVLAVHNCRSERRAQWDMGLKADCPYTAAYRGHYPEGYELKYVPYNHIQAHEGLTKARVLNQMLADLKGEVNDGAE